MIMSIDHDDVAFNDIAWKQTSFPCKQDSFHYLFALATGVQKYIYTTFGSLHGVTS